MAIVDPTFGGDSGGGGGGGGVTYTETTVTSGSIDGFALGGEEVTFAADVVIDYAEVTRTAGTSTAAAAFIYDGDPGVAGALVVPVVGGGFSDVTTDPTAKGPIQPAVGGDPFQAPVCVPAGTYWLVVENRGDDGTTFSFMVRHRPAESAA